MIGPLVHAWERRLAAVDTNRRVRPFEWGLNWLDVEPGRPPAAEAGPPVSHDEALQRVLAWSREVMTRTDAFYTGPPPGQFEVRDDVLRFPSAIVTPEAVNNTVAARIFRPATGRRSGPRRGVVVMAQWNADSEGHVGLCRLFARFGLTAVRLSLPYHDSRKPPELERADLIVSPNVGRTAQINRQAVLDVRGIVDWLEAQGMERIGIMGTSLGSCLAMLAMSHDPRIRAGAFNHVSPYFADVVWRGLSTRHVRAGLEGHISLDDLRAVLDADQPLAVHRSRPRSRDPADLRALRSQLSGGSFTPVRDRVQTSRGAALHDGSPLRPLHHGQGAVQISGRIRADEVFCDEAIRTQTGLWLETWSLWPGGDRQARNEVPRYVPSGPKPQDPRPKSSERQRYLKRSRSASTMTLPMAFMKGVTSPVVMA